MYLLFAGSNYYPSGGWDDFVGSFHTHSEALREWEKNKRDWGQIVSTETETVVEFLWADTK